MLSAKQWYTVEEVAARLALSEARIRQLLLRKQLNGVKFANAWAVEDSELRRFEKLDRPPGNPNFSRDSR